MCFWLGSCNIGEALNTGPTVHRFDEPEAFSDEEWHTSELDEHLNGVLTFGANGDSVEDFMMPLADGLAPIPQSLGGPDEHTQAGSPLSTEDNEDSTVALADDLPPCPKVLGGRMDAPRQDRRYQQLIGSSTHNNSEHGERLNRRWDLGPIGNQRKDENLVPLR